MDILRKHRFFVALFASCFAAQMNAEAAFQLKITQSNGTTTNSTTLAVTNGQTIDLANYTTSYAEQFGGLVQVNESSTPFSSSISWQVVDGPDSNTTPDYIRRVGTASGTWTLTLELSDTFTTPLYDRTLESNFSGSRAAGSGNLNVGYTGDFSDPTVSTTGFPAANGTNFNYSNSLDILGQATVYTLKSTTTLTNLTATRQFNGSTSLVVSGLDHIVPEPTSVTLAALGIIGVGLAARRRKCF